jgi:NADH-quinone oxidoreductase subunit F
MVQILESIENGTGTHADLELLDDIGDNILGKVLCALGEFAVYPVASYLDKWRSEFVAHVEQGGCPFGGSSSLDGILAPSDMHAHSPAAAEALV